MKTENVNDFFESRSYAKCQAEQLLTFLETRCEHRYKTPHGKRPAHLTEDIVRILYKGAKAFEERKKILEKT